MKNLLAIYPAEAVRGAAVIHEFLKQGMGALALERLELFTEVSPTGGFL
jgi:hypothetical protein